MIVRRLAPRVLFALATAFYLSSAVSWEPSFSLHMGTDDLQSHAAEAIVPDACDAAKARPVKFYHNDIRRCFDRDRKLDILIAFSREKMYELEETVSLLLAVPNFKHAEEPYTKPCVVVGSKLRAASEVLPVRGVDTVFELGAAGREWAVYFTYLISYYDNLPQHVVFMHGSIGCHLPAPTHRLRELWGMFRSSFCPQVYQAFLNGHYVVSRRRILANAVDMYRLLYRFVMHQPHHFLSADAHAQMKAAPRHYVNFVDHIETCEDTLEGHIVERAWSFIFGCYQRPDWSKCLESAAAIGALSDPKSAAAAGLLDPSCDYSGWQCYDSVPPWPLNTTHYMGGRPYVIVPP
ncbi:hypothetical protein GPECTOR_55g272 [Gonium pectorale]|uniref:Uncharacterized protein n=1 Tax=Gonium pectorale TaxID=33097 RepID=A0A150G650_GONPE|nr:hypothetical protein GPECTOR_55g272 [Gonium pectorale]|eukprot:KXZ45366.1 hypothetical protein GPECTOR_55g272 [Gonium pectorale]